MEPTMRLRQEIRQNVEIVGTSKQAGQMREFAKRVSGTKKTVLLLGETGSGKDQLAELIHQVGCPNERFVAVDCGAISKGIPEAELFGHKRGSFTGATEDRPGVITLAGQGVLFFNEIANMGMELQAQFLRILDKKPYRAVGGRDDMPVNAQIVAATNANLEKMVSRREFREDLYYRLKAVTFIIDPLRERNEDVPVLAEHFLSMENDVRRFSPTALTAMQEYQWPGNVRELKNTVSSAVFSSQDEWEIQPEHLKLSGTDARSESKEKENDKDQLTETQEKLLGQMIGGRESFWTVVHEPYISRDLTSADVRAIVSVGLEEMRGNYKSLTRYFNMPNEDYKKFLNFLRKHQCQVPFRGFRV